MAPSPSPTIIGASSVIILLLLPCFVSISGGAKFSLPTLELSRRVLNTVAPPPPHPPTPKPSGTAPSPVSSSAGTPRLNVLVEPPLIQTTTTTANVINSSANVFDLDVRPSNTTGDTTGRSLVIGNERSATFPRPLSSLSRYLFDSYRFEHEQEQRRQQQRHHHHRKASQTSKAKQDTDHDENGLVFLTAKPPPIPLPLATPPTNNHFSVTLKRISSPSSGEYSRSTETVFDDDNGNDSDLDYQMQEIVSAANSNGGQNNEIIVEDDTTDEDDTANDLHGNNNNNQTNGSFDSDSMTDDTVGSGSNHNYIVADGVAPYVNAYSTGSDQKMMVLNGKPDDVFVVHHQHHYAPLMPTYFAPPPLGASIQVPPVTTGIPETTTTPSTTTTTTTAATIAAASANSPITMLPPEMMSVTEMTRKRSRKGSRKSKKLQVVYIKVPLLNLMEKSGGKVSSGSAEIDDGDDGSQEDENSGSPMAILDPRMLQHAQYPPFGYSISSPAPVFNQQQPQQSPTPASVTSASTISSSINQTEVEVSDGQALSQTPPPRDKSAKQTETETLTDENDNNKEKEKDKEKDGSKSNNSESKSGTRDLSDKFYYYFFKKPKNGTSPSSSSSSMFSSFTDTFSDSFWSSKSNQTKLLKNVTNTGKAMTETDIVVEQETEKPIDTTPKSIDVTTEQNLEDREATASTLIDFQSRDSGLDPNYNYLTSKIEDSLYSFTPGNNTNWPQERSLGILPILIQIADDKKEAGTVTPASKTNEEKINDFLTPLLRGTNSEVHRHAHHQASHQPSFNDWKQELISPSSGWQAASTPVAVTRPPPALMTTAAAGLRHSTVSTGHHQTSPPPPPPSPANRHRHHRHAPHYHHHHYPERHHHRPPQPPQHFHNNHHHVHNQFSNTFFEDDHRFHDMSNYLAAAASNPNPAVFGLIPKPTGSGPIFPAASDHHPYTSSFTGLTGPPAGIPAPTTGITPAVVNNRQLNRWLDWSLKNQQMLMNPYWLNQMNRMKMTQQELLSAMQSQKLANKIAAMDFEQMFFPYGQGFAYGNLQLLNPQPPVPAISSIATNPSSKSSSEKSSGTSDQVPAASSSLGVFWNGSNKKRSLSLKNALASSSKSSETSTGKSKDKSGGGDKSGGRKSRGRNLSKFGLFG